jgi:hypothetical protein
MLVDWKLYNKTCTVKDWELRLSFAYVATSFAFRPTCLYISTRLPRDDCCEIRYWWPFWQFVDKLQVCFNWDKNIGHFTLFLSKLITLTTEKLLRSLQKWNGNLWLHFQGNSQQCFIVFVFEPKSCSSTIYTNTLLHFRGYNGYANSIQCYVICKLPIFPWSIYYYFIVRRIMHIFHHSAMEKMVCIKTKKNQNKIPYITFSEEDVAQRWFNWNLFKTSQVNKYAN